MTGVPGFGDHNNCTNDCDIYMYDASVGHVKLRSRPGILSRLQSARVRDRGTIQTGKENRGTQRKLFPKCIIIGKNLQENDNKTFFNVFFILLKKKGVSHSQDDYEQNPSSQLDSE